MRYNIESNKSIVGNECHSCIEQRKRLESNFDLLKERVTFVVATILFAHEEFGGNPDCSVERLCKIIFYDTSRKYMQLIKKALKALWGV